MTLVEGSWIHSPNLTIAFLHCPTQELPPASGAANGEPSVHILTIEVVDQSNGETVASSADALPGLQQAAQGSGDEEAESKERHPIDPVAPEQPPAIAVDPMPPVTAAAVAAPAGGNNRRLRRAGQGLRR